MIYGRRMRIAPLLVVTILAACSKGKDASETDNSKPAGSAAMVAPVKAELPPPPKESFKGSVRVINLLLKGGTTPLTIDVWGKRSFEFGPFQQAKGIAYGAATDWFGIPNGQSTVVVEAGASADTKATIGSVWANKDGEEATTLLYWKEGSAVSALMNTKPAGQNDAPEPPPAGKGLVYFTAQPLMHHEKTLETALGSRSFYVGDGKGACIHQRVQDKGFQAAILGGTQPTLHDLPPGKATFTFHKWPSGPNMSDKACTSPALFEVTVDVADGTGHLVVLHSRDGKAIEAAQFPLWKP